MEAAVPAAVVQQQVTAEVASLIAQLPPHQSKVSTKQVSVLSLLPSPSLNNVFLCRQRLMI